MSAYRSWSNHRAIRIGAGVAYYWLFAIVPLSALAIHLAGAFFSVNDIAAWATKALGSLQTTGQNNELTEHLQALLKHTQGLSFSVISGIAAAISASFAFAATQDAVKMVWDAPKLQGFWDNAIRRVLLFIAAVAVASLLVITLIAAAIFGTLESFLPGSLLDKTFAVISDVGVYLIAFGLVAVAFKFMPWPHISWRPPLVSAAITVVALSLATAGYAWYLGWTDQVSLAGAAGSVLVSLVWMYVIAQVFIGGAELTRAMHVRWEGPDPSAVADNSGGGGPAAEA
jgi:membrane protein